jgi:copper chaperone CopZ
MTMQTDMMHVTGMKCGGCTNKISLALNEIVGVTDVQVSLASGEVTVRYDERITSSQRLSAVVVSTGFGVDGIAATNGHDPSPTHTG